MKVGDTAEAYWNGHNPEIVRGFITMTHDNTRFRITCQDGSSFNQYPFEFKVCRMVLSELVMTAINNEYVTYRGPAYYR